MKKFNIFIFSVVIALMSFLFVNTHVFAEEEKEGITLTYVSFDTTKYKKEDMPLFFPVFDHDSSVLFDMDNSVTENHPKGVEIFHIPNATAEHYSFNGWIYYENGTEYILRRGDKIFNDTVFYARWTPTPKFISYSLDGGANNLGNSYLFDIKTTLTLEEPFKTGYSFIGWFTENDEQVTHYEKGSWVYKNEEVNNIVITGSYDVNLKAMWKINEYTISFDSNEGSDVSPITLEYGEPITKPDNPEREGYNFLGWNEEVPEFMPAENITLVANWEINAYTITFKSDGINHYQLTQDYNTPLSLPSEPNKVGHTFAGWYCDENFEVEYSLPKNMPAKNKTVYAKWDVKSYDLTLVIDNETKGPFSVFYGASIVIDAYEKEGYELNGWYTDESLEIKFDFEETMSNSDLTLYASWKQILFSVKFLDHSDVLFWAKEIYYEQKIIDGPLSFERPGYEFLGWFIDNEEEIINITTYVVTSEVTFRPSYKIITYNITYDLNGGSWVSSNPNKVEYTIEETPFTLINDDDLFKEGHSFSMFTDEEGNEITSIKKDQIGKLVICVEWTVNTYTVTFDPNGGVLEPSEATQNVFYDENIIEPVITKAGYEFIGFEKEDKTLWDFEEDKMPASNLTLKAVFKAKDGTKYIVNHYIQLASDFSYKLYQTEDKVGTTDTLVAAINLDITGYTFYEDHENNLLEDTINGDGSTVLNVYYTINKYTVFFTDWKNNTIKSQEVYYNESAIAPTSPEREGYTFTGWDKVFDKITGPTVIQAVYEINNYTVIFDYNNEEPNKEIVLEYNSLITKPKEPTKEGYSFVDWYRDSELNSLWNFSEDRVPVDGITLYAKWAIQIFTITFDSNGGTKVAQIKEDFGTTITKPVDPTKVGYTFKGWFRDVGFNIPYEFKDTMPAENIIIYAKWDINSYEVTFNSNGGSNILNETIEYNSQITEPSNPTKTGYVFAGWYKEETLNTLWDFENDVMQDNDITLYAKWTQATDTLYTINYYQQNINDDEYTIVTEDSKTYYGTTDTEVNASIKEYTGFVYDEEKSNSSGEIHPEGSLVLNIYYSREVYTITIEYNNGNNNGTILVRYQGLINVLDNPNKNYYDFAGWYLGNEVYNFDSEVTESHTITAKWNPIVYTITFKDGEDTLDLEPKTYTYESEDIILPSITKESHNFMGWHDELDNKVTEIKKNSFGDKVLTAQWEIKKFTVTFKDGESVLKTETVDWGKDATAPEDPEIEGYEFHSWDTDFSNVKSDLTVTATYNIKTYTVTFKDHNGSTLKTEIINHGSGATAPADPEREGYTFTGWDVDFDNVTGDLTVTATYTVNSYEVKFVNEDGTELDTQTVEYGTTPSYAGETPTKAPTAEFTYTFSGWTPALSEVTGDVTYTATYSSETNKYTVTFKDYDGTEIDTQIVEYGKAATAPEEPKREGYEFHRWDTDFSNVKSDLTVTATYNIKTYTVKFYDDDLTTLLKEEEVIHGNPATPPDDPTRTGYTFIRWDKDITNITKDLDVYATYDIIYYFRTLFYNYDISFNNKTDLANAFLTDLYSFVNPSGTLNEFMHGAGKTSGFAGTWYSNEEYRAKIFAANVKSGNNSYFLSHSSYQSKWKPLTDFMVTFVKVGNPDQDFWSSPFTGNLRLSQYFTNTKPGGAWSDEDMNKLPTGFKKTEVERYTVETNAKSLDVINRNDNLFMGWYNNPEFSGNTITIIAKGTIDNSKFYIKWEAPNTKSKIATAFLTDLFVFVAPGGSLNDFMHGAGKKSGFAGTWYSNEEYRAKIFGANIKSGNNNYFLSHSIYGPKWKPLANFMVTFVKVGNPDQDFWSSPFTGNLRLSQYFTNTKPGGAWSDEDMNKLPNWTY